MILANLVILLIWAILVLWAILCNFSDFSEFAILVILANLVIWVILCNFSEIAIWMILANLAILGIWAIWTFFSKEHLNFRVVKWDFLSYFQTLCNWTMKWRKLQGLKRIFLLIKHCLRVTAGIAAILNFHCQYIHRTLKFIFGIQIRKTPTSTAIYAKIQFLPSMML